MHVRVKNGQLESSLYTQMESIQLNLHLWKAILIRLSPGLSQVANFQSHSPTHYFFSLEIKETGPLLGDKLDMHNSGGGGGKYPSMFYA